MSPSLGTSLIIEVSFPRVSGDEPPSSADAIYAARFSPRERG